MQFGFCQCRLTWNAALIKTWITETGLSKSWRLCWLENESGLIVTDKWKQKTSRATWLEIRNLHYANFAQLVNAVRVSKVKVMSVTLMGLDFSTRVGFPLTRPSAIRKMEDGPQWLGHIFTLNRISFVKWLATKLPPLLWSRWWIAFA